MSLVRILLREAWARKAGTVLGILAVALVTGLFVGAKVLFTAAENDMRLKGKSMGFNMVYLPKGTSRHYYGLYACSDKTMPEDYYHALVKSDHIEADHFAGRLERRVDWKGRSILLTGTTATVAKGGKAPLGFSKELAPGTVVVGHEVANLLAADRGGRPVFDAWGHLKLDESGKELRVPVVLLDREFTAVGSQKKVNPKDDQRIYMNLRDAQDLLGLPGQISAIEALSCVCPKGSYTETIAALGQLLPEAEVEIPDEPKWMVREKIRRNQAQLTSAVLVVVALVAAGLIGAMAFLNVRQRREEIGLLRALGVGSERVALLFLGKAMLIGLAGALLGFALGSAFAVSWGPGIFELEPGAMKTDWLLLLWAAAAAPVMAALAATLPALSAVYLDPADALRQE